MPIPNGHRLRPVKNRENTIRATTTIINRKCSNCTTFGQLFLTKVIEIDATRFLDFSSKCTKNAFGGQAPPGPDGGPYSAPPDPLAGFKGSYF